MNFKAFLLLFIYSNCFAYEAPVLSRNFKKGEIIHKNDVIMIDVDYIGDDFVYSINQLIDTKTQTNIEANSLIMHSQLQQKVLVKKNSQVDIIFKRDNIKLQSKGIALENGSYGDFIKVKTLYNSKNITGKVMDKGNILIE